MEPTLMKKPDRSLRLEKIRRNRISVAKDQQQECCWRKNLKDKSSQDSVRSVTAVETKLRASKTSLNSSISSTSSSRSRARRRKELKIPDVSLDFMSATLQSLVEFTGDASRASVHFEPVTDEEAAFVKAVKKLACSTNIHGTLDPSLGPLLQQLSVNIAKPAETCKITIARGTHKNVRNMTLTKVPKYSAPSKPKPSIQFQSVGKMDPGAPEKPEGAAGPAPRPQGGALTRRNAKMLEAMSVPVEIDKGKRMMELMGWSGGALGVRQDGILEPILPTLDLAPGAGLGHVPPPKPAAKSPRGDFGLALLLSIRELVAQAEPAKVVEYKKPLTKSEQNIISSTVMSLNRRKRPPMFAHADLRCELLLRDLEKTDALMLMTELSPNFKTLTLVKYENPKTVNVPSKPTTNLECKDYDVIHENDVQRAMTGLANVNLKISTTRRWALRKLFLNKFVDLMESDVVEREFRIPGILQKNVVAFLVKVVASVNDRMQCVSVADEEKTIYNRLMETALRNKIFLSINVVSTTKIILRKIMDSTTCDKNPVLPVSSQSTQAIVATNNNETEVNNNESSKKNAELETKRDIQVKTLVHNNTDIIKEVDQAKSDTKIQNGKVKVEDTNRKCDINVKDNKIHVDQKIVKREIQTDDGDSSWSTCSDDVVDIFEFGKVNKTSRKRSFTEANEKDEAKSKTYVVVVTPRNTKANIHVDVFRKLQTFMWKKIDENDCIPLLKCFGVQNGGLVYSCSSKQDVAWLKEAIKASKLDLKVRAFNEDIIQEVKSRLMAVRVNTFIPLEAEKLLNRIELYNDISTHLWTVLSCELFDSHVIVVVEVDETSFEYISEENFSVHIGIDKAQFSIIF